MSEIEKLEKRIRLLENIIISLYYNNYHVLAGGQQEAEQIRDAIYKSAKENG